MAEAPTLQQEEVKVKGTFAGQAIDLAAKGTTIILLAAVAAVGVLALREHTKRESAEAAIMTLLNRQNDLLHDQTEVLRAGQYDIECQLGIVIFNYQFLKGNVEWDLLPPILHGCLPEYSKKLPRKEPR